MVIGIFFFIFFFMETVELGTVKNGSSMVKMF